MIFYYYCKEALFGTVKKLYDVILQVDKLYNHCFVSGGSMLMVEARIWIAIRLTDLLHLISI
jgi:hypothetical protein